jgi:hypothetical protein
MEPYRHPWSQSAVHLGQLVRGSARWEVYLESEASPDLGARRGRLHFLSGERHRTTAWIFLEWTEKEVLDRARDFSAGELWSFLEGLTP